MKRRSVWALAPPTVLVAAVAGAAAVIPAGYEAVSQLDLVTFPDRYHGRRVSVTGPFVFGGSDFCYQIRESEIHTRDYFCFTLGSPGLVRLYLKRGHEQADRLLHLTKGAEVTAWGTFEHLGADHNFLVVDGIAVEEQP